MTEISLTTARPGTVAVDALVLAAYAGEEGPVAVLPEFGEVVAAAAVAGASGAASTVITIRLSRA